MTTTRVEVELGCDKNTYMQLFSKHLRYICIANWYSRTIEPFFRVCFNLNIQLPYIFFILWLKTFLVEDQHKSLGIEAKSRVNKTLTCRFGGIYLHCTLTLILMHDLSLFLPAMTSHHPVLSTRLPALRLTGAKLRPA